MKIKFKYYLIVFVTILFISPDFFAQVKDKSWLLTDTVAYNDLSINDKHLVDSLLPLYHIHSADTFKINIVNALVNNLENQALSYKYVKTGIKISNSITAKSILNHKAVFISSSARFYYRIGNTQEAIKFYSQAAKLFEELGDQINQAANISDMGIVYLNTADFANSLKYQKQALNIRKKINDKRGIAMSFNEISMIYSQKGDVKGALDYISQALKIFRGLKDRSDVAMALNNVGTIYLSQQDTVIAMKNFEEALSILSTTSDIDGYSQLLNNVASMYLDMNNYEKAEDLYFKSLKIKKERGNKYLICETLSNIGLLYKRWGNFGKAMTYYEEALKLQFEINDKDGIAYSYKCLSNLFAKKNDLVKSAKYAQLFYDLSKEIGVANYIRDASKMLYQLYKKQNKPLLALQMYEQYTKMRDSLENEETQKASIRSQFQSEYDKKVIADSVKLIEEKKVTQSKLIAQQAQIKEERTQRFALYGGLLLVAVFSAFMFNRFKITQKQKQIIEVQKEIVEEKQKEIIDSINYAKRIQYTLLANEQLMTENLTEHFVYFKPKAVVSGDFYWAIKKDNLFYLAVCDSTGHGVPGAFMSLLNINFLNEAVNEKNIKAPNEILNHVRGRLIENMDGGRDGMDAVIICIDRTKKQITYAAANNEPLLIKNNILSELQKDKMPVGKGENENSFTLFTLTIEKNDIVYLYTDGYADQFGGPKGKKFKYKELNHLLLSNSLIPFSEQSKLLDKKFKEWKGQMEQVDDVCIIGIKI